MLGIFDSGFGGLTVLKPIHERLPEISTLYLGDNARSPYGVRSQEEIFTFTLEGVRFLFDRGCPLVLLACNTASAQALRRIQQEILPNEYPSHRLLGVIRPAAEYLADRASRVGIFATPATVESNAYAHELSKLNPAIHVSQIACPGLVDLIEAGQHQSEDTSHLIKHFAEELLAQDPSIQEVLLACTHYPLVYELFRKHIPPHINVLTQGTIVAESLAQYLTRHLDMHAQLEKTGVREYITTNGEDVSSLASQFYGSTVQFKKTLLGRLA